MMNEYIKSIMDRDPAAKSKLGIILTYPGVKAVFFHTPKELSRYACLSMISPSFTLRLRAITLHLACKRKNTGAGLPLRLS